MFSVVLANVKEVNRRIHFYSQICDKGTTHF